VLEIGFGDGSKIIVNSQAATREIRVAAKSGGYHVRGDGERWFNIRDATELFAALSAYVSQQAAVTVNLMPGNGQSLMDKTVTSACPFPIVRQNNWILTSSGLRMPPSGTSSLGAAGTFSR
jgi:hypothetical protein